MALTGRRVLVTGVSRPGGIGYAVARRCARAGAAVLLHGLPAYDAVQGYPDAAGALAAVVEPLRAEGLDVRAVSEADLVEPHAPAAIMREARPVDGLVLNHAYSTRAPLGAWDAADIDRHLQVNVRASMLLLQEFAAQLPEGRPGSVVLLTSGQYLGPMVDEVAYAVSKEAVRGLCAQAAAALAPLNVRVNCVNPGPTDTGYATGEAWEEVRARFPAGRWGAPDDAARLIEFLLGEEAAWITGQTIASEGGFRR
jgi:3-oxoacyl-[acyl-carrier protein] reductase